METHDTAARALRCMRKASCLAMAVTMALIFLAAGNTFHVGAAEKEDAEVSADYRKGTNTDEQEEGEAKDRQEEAAAELCQVTVRLDGEFFDYKVGKMKVGDFFRSVGIELGEEDEVSVSLDDWLEDGDIISVQRHIYYTVEEEEAVPSYQELIPTSLLRPGKTRVLSEGEDGLLVHTYMRYYIGGELVLEELVDTETIKEAKTTKLLVGANYEPISPLDFGCELDENGVPTEYAEVLTSQRATGYSARPGAGTASGYKAMVGYVAVNPNEIPYGTKMYIRSADGKFVYGYAVAADTGIALMDDRVDVDLFYGTYLESKLNGLRQVDIYILE